MFKKLACSFCGKRAGEVAKLVEGPRVLMVGPRVHICDQCAAMAIEIMHKPDRDGRAPRA